MYVSHLYFQLTGEAENRNTDKGAYYIFLGIISG